MATLQRVIRENFESAYKDAVRREIPSVFVRLVGGRCELVGINIDGTTNEVTLFRGNYDQCGRIAMVYDVEGVKHIGVDG